MIEQTEKLEQTENLLFKLEEKMMMLMTNAEDLRHQVQQLQQENASLKQQKETHTRKLQDLVSLLDSVNSTEASQSAHQHQSAHQSSEQQMASSDYAAAKPILVHN